MKEVLVWPCISMELPIALLASVLVLLLEKSETVLFVIVEFDVTVADTFLFCVLAFAFFLSDLVSEFKLESDLRLCISFLYFWLPISDSWAQNSFVSLSMLRHADDILLDRSVKLMNIEEEKTNDMLVGFHF